MRKLLVLLSVVTATAVLAGPAFAVGPAPDPGTAQIETQFLTCMVPHHRSAAAMAQIALQKATHPGLKRMAQDITGNQDAEIAEMTQWLHDWYGMDPPAGTTMPTACVQAMAPMLHGRMPDMDTALQSLQSKSGAEFDVAFMSDMSQHHGMGILMSGRVLIAGYHPELYTLADNIVISKGQEIGQMDQWLQSWYGLRLPVDTTATPVPTGATMPAPTSTPMAVPTPSEAVGS